MKNTLTITIKDVKVPKEEIVIGEVSINADYEASAEEITAITSSVMLIGKFMFELYKYDTKPKSGPSAN